MQKNEALNNFGGRNVVSTLSQEVEVDAKAVIQYLLNQEILLEIIETQFSRAGPVLETYVLYCLY